MVNKFEDFDSYIDFSPLTTGKKRALFTDAETAGEFSEKKICQTDKILNSNVSYIKMCKYSAQMLLGYFQFVCFNNLS